MDVRDSVREAVIIHHNSFLNAGNKYILQYLRLAQDEADNQVMGDEGASDVWNYDFNDFQIKWVRFWLHEQNSGTDFVSVVDMGLGSRLFSS